LWHVEVEVDVAVTPGCHIAPKSMQSIKQRQKVRYSDANYFCKKKTAQIDQTKLNKKNTKFIKRTKKRI